MQRAPPRAIESLNSALSKSLAECQAIFLVRGGIRFIAKYVSNVPLFSSLQSQTSEPSMCVVCVRAEKCEVIGESAPLSPLELQLLIYVAKPYTRALVTSIGEIRAVNVSCVHTYKRHHTR